MRCRYTRPPWLGIPKRAAQGVGFEAADATLLVQASSSRPRSEFAHDRPAVAGSGATQKMTTWDPTIVAVAAGRYAVTYEGRQTEVPSLDFRGRSEAGVGALGRPPITRSASV
jgi:hypothetical protein